MNECNFNSVSKSEAKFSWKIIGCAVPEKLKPENLPCQDKIARYRDEKVSVIALADGAGSASLSHLGAQRVCDAVCMKIAENFDALVDASKSQENIKIELYNYLIGEITQLAKEIPCEIGDLASTLLAAASDGKKYIMLHIGDGIIGIFKNGKCQVASEPYTSGEYLGATVFVTSRNALQHFRILRGNLLNDGEDEAVSGFVLMSDGAGESYYYRRGKTFVPYLDKIMLDCVSGSESEREEILLKEFNEEVRNRTLDDCSMILMCRE